ncbi:metal-dependent phosphohydrolase [Ornithinimicrobium kibberense]|jgi:predicted metal-dependent HD superfamily phosphohydrolase|uniref:Metal-dependent HD superfamily phosphohydrolase n=2 Tax=Ornithinimicrobium kibberense TaxID=282060 RepID=A0ABV5V4Z9_9MICO|nr:metal-dependent phosphohydrolase [Ornithinimicrobium kibberense]
MRTDPELLLDRWLLDAAELAPHAGRDRWLGEGSRLLAGWTEAHRRYHTVQHLEEMLAALDELEGAVPLSPEEALLARTVAWYHDLAHDPRAAAGSNEHRSATLARDHLHHLGADDVVVDVVEEGVLMTATHEVAPDAGPLAVLDAVHDADLWILSAPPERYAAYRRQVREEYAHVPDDSFRSGRSAVLRAFAGRDRLYRTTHGHRRWTERARRNLAGELADLTDGQ